MVAWWLISFLCSKVSNNWVLLTSLALPPDGFRSQSHAAIAVVATAVGLALFAYSGIGGNQRAGFLFLQDIEQRTLDLRFALRGKRAPDPRIVIVGIDDKTLQTIGSLPSAAK